MRCFAKETLIALLVAGTSITGAELAFAKGRAAHGAILSAQCTACHGGEGISVAASIPNLAGQKYIYLLNQLMAFKHGTRKNLMMHAIASGLSRQDAKDVASYYAHMKIKVTNSKKG